MQITIDDIKFCLKLITDYSVKAETQRAKAKTVSRTARGGLMSHAAQNDKNALRMKQNLQYQLDWLAENNEGLFLEAKQLVENDTLRS